MELGSGWTPEYLRKRSNEELIFHLLSWQTHNVVNHHFRDERVVDRIKSEILLRLDKETLWERCVRAMKAVQSAYRTAQQEHMTGREW